MDALGVARKLAISWVCARDTCGQRRELPIERVHRWRFFAAGIIIIQNITSRASAPKRGARCACARVPLRCFPRKHAQRPRTRARIVRRLCTATACGGGGARVLRQLHTTTTTTTCAAKIRNEARSSLVIYSACASPPPPKCRRIKATCDDNCTIHISIDIKIVAANATAAASPVAPAEQ